MKSVESKTSKGFTAYSYDFKFKDQEWTLIIAPDKTGNILSAQMYNTSAKKNTIYAELSFAFKDFAKEWAIIDNATKKSIPYFTDDDFSKGYYGEVSQHQIDLLKTKTAQITYIIAGSKFLFINSEDKIAFKTTRY